MKGEGRKREENRRGRVEGEGKVEVKGWREAVLVTCATILAPPRHWRKLKNVAHVAVALK